MKSLWGLNVKIISLILSGGGTVKLVYIPFVQVEVILEVAVMCS